MNLIILSDGGSTPMTSFNLITALEALSPKAATLGVRVSIHEFGGDTNTQATQQID